jgi:hypothetical protein
MKNILTRFDDGLKQWHIDCLLSLWISFEARWMGEFLIFKNFVYVGTISALSQL